MAIHAHSTPVPAPQRGLLRVTPSLESVLTETLRTIERLTAQARARVAAYDAAKSATVADLPPLPSLTSAFARRREIFGAFDGEND